MFFLSGLTLILAFILSITLLVGIHELGHFLVARLFKVKVIRFSIGFGKRLLNFHDRKGTEYAIAAIPIGGYIKLLDEYEEPVAPSELKFAFNRQHPLKKMAIALAGPLGSFLLGVVILWILFVIGTSHLVPVLGPIKPGTLAAQAGLHQGQRITAIDQMPVEDWQDVTEQIAKRLGDRNILTIAVKEKTKIRNYSLLLNHLKNDLSIEETLEHLGLQPRLPPLPPDIASVDANSPAEKSGLKPGDHILRVNHQKISDFNQVIDIIRSNPTKMLSLQIVRQGKILNFQVTPQWHPIESVARIGIQSNPIQWTEEFMQKKSYPIGVALIKSWQESYQIITLNAQFLFKMITGRLSWKNLSGPLGIAKGATLSLESGWSHFLKFLAFISLSLGFANLLPIPALDGGLIFYGVIELILRRPLSKKAYEWGQNSGLILLLLLIGITLINDIIRSLPGLH